MTTSPTDEHTFHEECSGSSLLGEHHGEGEMKQQEQQQPEGEEELVDDDDPDQQLVTQFDDFYGTLSKACGISFERLSGLLGELKQCKADIQRTNLELRAAQDQEFEQRNQFLNRLDCFQERVRSVASETDGGGGSVGNADVGGVEADVA